MTHKEKLYAGLCIILSMLIIVSNLTYRKFVTLDMQFYKFEISVGAILYPLTFIITDVITEFFGKERIIFWVCHNNCVS